MDIISLKQKTESEIIELFYNYQSGFETAKMYHAVLDNMKEGFQILDSDFRYTYVNNAAVEQSKLKREELIGCKMTDSYPGIENTIMFSVLSECMKTKVSRKIQNKFTYPDDSTAWFELSIQSITEGLFILSMDITERKKAEQDREKHILEIQQLLFKISHEVRQPVCQILGVSHLLDNSLISPEELKQVISYMKRSIHLLDTYTKDLTTFVSEMKMNADNQE